MGDVTVSITALDNVGRIGLVLLESILAYPFDLTPPAATSTCPADRRERVSCPGSLGAASRDLPLRFSALSCSAIVMTALLNITTQVSSMSPAMKWQVDYCVGC